jgi:hypothetical protein
MKINFENKNQEKKNNEKNQFINEKISKWPDNYIISPVYNIIGNHKKIKKK